MPPTRTPPDTVTPREKATSYNNFYEFGTDKTRPGASTPASLRTRPWTVAVEGEVAKPGTIAHRGRCSAPSRARGADLPAALRRGLVDGDPVAAASRSATS